MRIHPGVGGASYTQNSLKIIRLVRKGCANRPFFHIVVQESFKNPFSQPIEQLGSYDPFPNKHNEKLVAINFKRLEFWMQQRIYISISVKKLLGLSGYLPVNPETFREAWNRRKQLTELIKELKISAGELEKDELEKESSSPSEEKISNLTENNKVISESVEESSSTSEKK